MKVSDTRSIALSMLIRINEEGIFSHLVIRETFNKLAHYEKRDKALIKRLTEGTLEQQIKIDYIINQFSKKPVVEMKPLIRNLLRLSVYQIIFMSNIPDRAACDEAVKLVAKRGFSSLKGFINAILRNIIRNKDNLNLPDEAGDKLLYLSIAYSMPQWIVEKWLKEYDYEKVKIICQNLLETRPMTVRLHGNPSVEDIKMWQDNLNSIGAEAKQHPYLGYAYELHNVENIAELPCFKMGFFIVQDVSSMLVVEAAGIKADDIVVDVCAAPGGKSLHAAEKAKKVIARDLSESKCEYIRENAARLNQTNIEISVYDATVLDETLLGKADFFLADVPCSGFGIIGKKPDIKYKNTPVSIDELVKLQRRILATVWQYVKPGGILVYSTCTINHDENEAMMEWFTENYPFAYDLLPDNLSSLNIEQRKSAQLKLLPGFHQTDGFFICRLRRIDVVARL